MKGGDISNETPPKIVVIVDVIGAIETEEVSAGFLKKQTVQKLKKLELKNISHLWKVANKYGLSVELAGFADLGWTQESLDSIMDTLEKRAANPFNYAEVYEDVDELIDYLPYRSNLRGVIDVPGRVARYGSYGVELMNL